MSFVPNNTSLGIRPAGLIMKQTVSFLHMLDTGHSFNISKMTILDRGTVTTAI